MPKGFVELQRIGRDDPQFIAVDQIARFGASHPRGSFVVCKTVEDGENDTLIVADTPREIAALIEQAQGENTLLDFTKAPFQVAGGAR